MAYKLTDMGYTERESEFLVLACSCGGSWLMRQFISSTGAKYGKVTKEFLDRVENYKHAAVLGKGKGRVYCASADLMEIATGSNKSPGKGSVKNLMALDFALMDPERRWFHSVSDRAAWLSKNSKSVWLIPRDDRFPVYALEDGLGVVYCDPDIPDKQFSEFLIRWLPGLATLPRSEVTFVTSMDLSVDAAKKTFEQAAGGKLDGVLDLSELKVSEFEERKHLEWMLENDVSNPDLGIKELDRLCDLRESRYADLYAVWDMAGVEAFENTVRIQAECLDAGKVAFNSCVLKESYIGEE